MRILIVEDERQMADALSDVLRKNNYTADVVCDGESGLDFALSGIYDIIVLDIMLPKMDGISILKEIRKKALPIPIILLTAKSETEDKVIGLDCGADDYLTKPFKTDELLARLRVLSRRKGELMPSNALSYGDVEVNPHTLIIYCGKKSFKLTLKESQLLELFIETQNSTLSKNKIIEKVWGFDSEADDHYAEVYVSFLRKKLLQLNSEVSIQTIRGVGYKLVYGKIIC
ncbi:MAG: response regulator transcription factor [Clostridium sp.]|uniref:response regulator transcription factor n=1 Tax=Clostridium sp. TaxID=1506 RepID=UPI003D6D5732